MVLRYLECLDRKDIWPVKNLCNLFPKVLFLNKWRKKREGNDLSQVHLENDQWDGG